MIRLKSLISKLMELDEERKFPHLNPKISIHDTILKLAERDDTFVSFRDVLKGGLNPNSSWDTPIGIYMYPLKKSLETYGADKKLGIKFPFAIEKPYVYIVTKNSNIKELDMDIYTKQDGDRDVDKLIKIYSSKISEKILNDLKKDSPQLTKHKNVNVGAFWYFCYKLSEMLRSEKGGKSSVYWTKMLKTDLGYDLVIDGGNGVIHGNERCQAFFTSENTFTINTVIEKSNVETRINYEKIANNPKVLSIFLGDRTNKLTHDIVRNLLHNSRDKQKMVDVLLSKNVSLTDDNMRELITYSTDPQKMVDFLLSKNITLTDSNVRTLLTYSPDKQKMVDVLLSKNITLTDSNVSILLSYSTDKQKMVDVLFSKNVSLTDDNVYYLLKYSPDLQKTIDVLLSKNVPLTHANVNYLLKYSTDQQKMVDVLLSKGLSIDNILTDTNVNYLLRSSPDQQKTIDMLLSKNITLTDYNVYYLLQYSPDLQKIIDMLLSKGLSIDNILTDSNVRSLLNNLPDKQKTIDVLFSKNVPLTEDNVYYLLGYSPDKQDTQQKIDMLKAKQQLSESKSKYTDYYSYLNELDYKVEPYDVHPNGLVGWKGKIVYTTPDKFLSLAKKLEHPSKTSLAY